MGLKKTLVMLGLATTATMGAMQAEAKPNAPRSGRAPARVEQRAPAPKVQHQAGHHHGHHSDKKAFVGGLIGGFIHALTGQPVPPPPPPPPKPPRSSHRGGWGR